MDYSSEEEFDNYINDRILIEQRTIITRKVVRDFQDPFDYYSSEEFRKRYRFSKDVVYYILLPLVMNDLLKLTERGLPVPPMYQLLITIRFYSSGCFQMITGDLIEVSQPSVSRIVKKVSLLICMKIKQFINFPLNLENVKQNFYAIAQFPGVIGAVDGTHIPIQIPGGIHAEVYRNRKKTFSINTQIVCGPHLEIGIRYCCG